MTDLEIIRRCAEAMKDESAAALEFLEEGHRGGYEPLYDDAQAMALVKKFRLGILYCDDDEWQVFDMRIIGVYKYETISAPLNRAICLCAAKMREAK